jgi:hypothetical protein
MPEEVFIIVIVAIMAGTFTSVVKMIVGFLQSRQNVSEKGSLTESQLRRMIEEAVGSSVTPLEDRFDRLESRLNRLIESPVEQRKLAPPKDDPVAREMI